MWLLLTLACGGPADEPADTAPATTEPVGDTSPPAYHEVYEDEGTACLGAPDDGGVSADVEGELIVSLGCAPCDAFVESAICDATASDATVRVAAEGIVHVEPNLDPECPCTPVEAYCPVPPLAAGTWTLSYGGGSATFEVPAADVVCVDATGGGSR